MIKALGSEKYFIDKHVISRQDRVFLKTLCEGNYF